MNIIMHWWFICSQVCKLLHQICVNSLVVLLQVSLLVQLVESISLPICLLVMFNFLGAKRLLKLDFHWCKEIIQVSLDRWILLKKPLKSSKCNLLECWLQIQWNVLKLTFLDPEVILERNLKKKCLKDSKKFKNKEVLWGQKNLYRFLIYNLKRKEEVKDIEKWNNSMKCPN